MNCFLRFATSVRYWILALLLAAATLASAQAAPSAYQIEQVELQILGFYQNIENEDLSAGDREEYAQSTAATIGALDPTAFNDVVGHLLASYYLSPNLRPAIEILLDAITRDPRVQAELSAQEEHHPVIVVFDDVLRVWGLATTIGIGKSVWAVHGTQIASGIRHPVKAAKSLWASRGAGLTSVPGFKQAIKTYTSQVPRGKLTALGITGMGVSVGLTRLLEEYLATHKLDPKKRLREVQTSVIHVLGVQAARRRDQVRAIPNQVPASQRAQTLETVRKTFEECDSIKAQITHLFVIAPHLKSRMTYILEDSETARTLANKIKLRFEAQELEEAARGLPSLP